MAGVGGYGVGYPCFMAQNWEGGVVRPLQIGDSRTFYHCCGGLANDMRYGFRRNRLLRSRDVVYKGKARLTHKASTHSGHTIGYAPPSSLVLMPFKQRCAKKNQVDEECLRSILDSECANPQQDWLQFRNLPFQLGDEGATFVANYLKQPGACIRYLNLSHSTISHIGALALADALQHPGCPLRKLDLSNNPLGDEGVLALADALLINTCLKILLLDLTQATDTGGKFLVAAVARNSGLTTVTLKGNGISHQVRRGLALATQPLPANDLLQHQQVQCCLPLSLVPPQDLPGMLGVPGSPVSRPTCQRDAAAPPQKRGRSQSPQKSPAWFPAGVPQPLEPSGGTQAAHEPVYLSPAALQNSVNRLHSTPSRDSKPPPEEPTPKPAKVISKKRLHEFLVRNVDRFVPPKREPGPESDAQQTAPQPAPLQGVLQKPLTKREEELANRFLYKAVQRRQTALNQAHDKHAWVPPKVRVIGEDEVQQLVDRLAHIRASRRCSSAVPTVPVGRARSAWSGTD